MCEHKGSDHWRALEARDKRSSKSKSLTPTGDDVLFAPDKVATKTKTSKPSHKTLGVGTAGSVQYPNDKSEQGISSAADPVKPPSSQCTVRGFPPESRVLGD